MSSLHESILRSLALFAAQDQAPTLLELHRALIRVSPEQAQPDLFELWQVLENKLNNVVVSDSGLYALKAHQEPLRNRLEKYLRTAALFKKTRRWVSGLHHLPYVRAAAIFGSCAQMNAAKNSDIDLFIIASSGRMYTARFLVSAYFQLIGMRRHGNKIAGRFCLNHYITDSTYLGQDHTVYTALEYSSLIGVFGKEHIEKFWKRNFNWIGKFLLLPTLPNGHHFKHVVRSSSILARFLEFLFFPISGILEGILKTFQKRRIRQGEFIIVSDSELSFHPGSRGQRILERYNQLFNTFAKNHPILPCNSRKELF